MPWELLKRPLLGQAFAAIVAGCSTGEPAAPVPTRVWIYATGAVLGVNESVKLVVTVEDSSTGQRHTFPGSAIDPWPTHFRLTWSSSDSMVATVTNTGVVTGKAPGRATIWVQVESGRDSGTVIVGAPEPSTFAAVHAGGTHSCALDALRNAYCWGSDFGGSLGRGRIRQFTLGAIAAPVILNEPATSVVLGGGHACATTTSGATFCWGNASYGQLGDGSNADDFMEVGAFGRGTPVRVLTTVQLHGLVAGGNYTCGIDPNGAAHCWGWNALGELGRGTWTVGGEVTPAPVNGGHSFVALGTGALHTCGITADGVAYCWGEDRAKKLGVDPAVPRSSCFAGPCITEPARVATTVAFTSIVGGSEHTCAVSVNAEAYCWGGNARGQLGTGSVTPSETPVRVTGDLRFRSLAAGSFHTCGITLDNHAYCWGENLYGQLGSLSASRLDPNPTPALVDGAREFTQISALASHTCALDTAGGAYCWGWSRAGRLGNGRFEPVDAVEVGAVTTPVRVLGPM